MYHPTAALWKYLHSCKHGSGKLNQKLQSPSFWGEIAKAQTAYMAHKATSMNAERHLCNLASQQQLWHWSLKQGKKSIWRGMFKFLNCSLDSVCVIIIWSVVLYLFDLLCCFLFIPFLSFLTVASAVYYIRLSEWDYFGEHAVSMLFAIGRVLCSLNENHWCQCDQWEKEQRKLATRIRFWRFTLPAKAAASPKPLHCSDGMAVYSHDDLRGFGTLKQ